MAVKNPLLQIRKELESHVGKTIKLRANRGRRKSYEKLGSWKTLTLLFLLLEWKKNITTRDFRSVMRMSLLKQSNYVFMAETTE